MQDRHQNNTDKETDDIYVNDFIDLGSPHSSQKRQQGRTVAVFLCGTGSSQGDIREDEYYYDGNLIASTYDRTIGEPYIHKIIVDGPASGEKDKDRLWVPYPKWGYSFYRSLATGMGVEERLKHVIAVLTNDQRHVPPGEKSNAEKLQRYLDENPQYAQVVRVNIVGWSRGGVAAVKLANMIYLDSDLSNVEINLFLLDPVPGPVRYTEDYGCLNPAVRDCRVLIPYHERSALFQPLLPKPGKSNLVRYYFLPGNHASMVGNTFLEKKFGYEVNLREVSEITRYLMQHFLHVHGTHPIPEAMLHLKLSDLLEWYNRIKRDESAYEKSAIAGVYTWSKWAGPEWGRPITVNGEQAWLEKYRDQHLPFNREKFVDQFHEGLTDIVKLAKDFVSKPVWIENIELCIDGLLSLMKSNHPEDTTLLVRAISEELMERYHPDYLLDISKRCQTRDELCCFMLFIADERAQCIQEKTRVDKQRILAELQSGLFGHSRFKLASHGTSACIAKPSG